MNTQSRIYRETAAAGDPAPDICERIRLRRREVFGPFAQDSALMGEAAIVIEELREALARVQHDEEIL